LPTITSATRVYDATSINDARRCPEFWRTRHGLGLVRDYDDDAPKSGQAWHAAMRQWFAQPPEANAALNLTLANAALRDAWGEEPLFVPAPVKRPRALFEALLGVYAEKWPRERDPFDVLRNEEWCDAPFYKFYGLDSDSKAYLGSVEVVYGGIVDRLIRMDGRTYVMDTKTTSSFLNDAYFANYELSTQLRGYVALELVNGRECEGAYIDAVHVDTRYHKAKPEHLVRHGPIRYDQARLSAWARDAERTIREIERNISELGLDTRWEQRDLSCRAYNKLCPYFDRCTVAEELAATLPGYREEPWRPNERA
jgi:hypothetical protein